MHMGRIPTDRRRRSAQRVCDATLTSGGRAVGKPILVCNRAHYLSVEPGGAVRNTLVFWIIDNKWLAVRTGLRMSLVVKRILTR